MSARDDLLDEYGRADSQPLGTLAELRGKLDAYRTEVLGKAIGRLRAIPVNCTALTGPVWYGNGWNSAITVLEEIAEYQGPDDEAYPGELQRLRAHALAMQVAARKAVMVEVQRLALDHAVEDANARDKARQSAPDFFQPGRTYTHVDDGTDWKFRVDTVTTHPEDGERTALGWRHFRGEWEAIAYGEDDYEIHLLVGLAEAPGGESR
ncbi:hypothetical protein ACFV20_19550 [Streptomyces sp. NPDC059696]|uniref:hypothetical protein n=1 Tax=Streptomyces sp. NPDC059696 TaxID=3346911 RepID=UPI0036B770BF